jgi:hypothetical protein
LLRLAEEERLLLLPALLPALLPLLALARSLCALLFWLLACAPLRPASLRLILPLLLLLSLLPLLAPLALARDEDAEEERGEDDRDLLLLLDAIACSFGMDRWYCMAGTGGGARPCKPL